MLDGFTFAKSKKGCIVVDFPYQACYQGGWIACNGWQRVATPREPNDCDYEFFFPANQNFVYGTTWWADLAITWWGGCVAKRSHTYFTGMLIGNGAVNYCYAGSASLFSKRFKTKN